MMNIKKITNKLLSLKALLLNGLDCLNSQNKNKIPMNSFTLFNIFYFDNNHNVKHCKKIPIIPFSKKN